jgi:5-methyltetrahydrofolate--homocysteine methyltransferase
VLVGIAFSTAEQGGRTMMGDTVEGCAQALSEHGADAVGANCGDLDPMQMAQVIGYYREATDLPLLAEPNAGRPQLIDGKTVFGMAPGPFAEGIGACVEAGARIVGGCCGTTPEHIGAMQNAN